MEIEVQIGSDEMVGKDLPDLMEWLYKRVHRRKATHPAEMVLLALVAGECLMDICRKEWPYRESPDEFFEVLRCKAKEVAASLKNEDNRQGN